MAEIDLDKKLEELQWQFRKEILSLKEEISALQAQVRELREEQEPAPAGSSPRSAAKESAPTAIIVEPVMPPKPQLPIPAKPVIEAPAPPPVPAAPKPSAPAPAVTSEPQVPQVVAEPPALAAPPPLHPVPPPMPAKQPEAYPASPSFSGTYSAFKIPPREPARPRGERLKSALALEEVLGTNWLNKLGIIILVLGLALFGIYELGQLGAAGKVLLSFVAGAALLVAGILFERRERYRVLGRTGIGGGWALLFFTSYAMFNVAAMRLPITETGDVLLMLAVATGMAVHTLRYRSQLVTGLAFLLGYSTIALSHDTVYSLGAGAVLAAALVALVIRMKWYELEVFGILASYLNHLYWLYKILGPEGANHRHFPEYWASTVILLFYWLAYRASYVARKIAAPQQEQVSALAALLNTILLLVVMKFQSARPELAFYALLALGLLEFACGQLPWTRRRRTAFALLSTIGAVLMVMAVPFRFSGGNVALFWMIGGETFLLAGIAVKERVFRQLGLAAGLTAALHVLLVDAFPFVMAHAGSQKPMVASGVLYLTLGSLFYLNSQFIARRWAELISGSFESVSMTLHSYIGCITLVMGTWAVWTGDWTALSWSVIVLGLAFAAGRWQAEDLFAQSAMLAVLALMWAQAVNLGDAMDRLARLHRLITVPLLAAAYYLSAYFLRPLPGKLPVIVRHLFTWAGTLLLALLIWRELPDAWVAVGWMALGLALTFAGRRLKFATLCYQENVLAVAVLLRLILVNYGNAAAFGHISLRLITIALVAAGIYAASRRSSLPEDPNGFPVAVLHTLAATGLLAALAWYEVSTAWLAVVWAGFALVLAALDRRFDLPDLGGEAHALAALAVARVATVNLYSASTLQGVHLRLITTGAVALILYALAAIVRLPENLRQRNYHHVYSWIASALATVLMWYELQPLSVAVAWGLFGLLLVEFGLLRKSAPVRFQGYVALGAAFVRIFFANLAIPSTPGETIGPRLLTVAPLAVILFFIYSQLESRKDTQYELRLRIDNIFCYAGTAAVSALLYYELQPRADWIVTAWSIQLLTLLTLALLLHREVFLHQGLLLSAAALSRGIFHNLFGESYFNTAGWSGRYMVLGSAITIMFLTLAPAFRLRHILTSDKAGVGASSRRGLAALAARPEQVMFFVPFLLLTLMMALKLRAGMVTVAWGVEAVLIIAAALIIGERSYRLTGLGLLLVCVGKIIALDAWRLQPRDRYLTLIILGAALLTVSFLYSKYREAIRQLL